MPGVPDGFQGNEYVPVPVATDTRFTTITAGALHTCGIDRAGKAWCWGNDYKGRLGDGKDDQASEYKPVAVAGKHRFTTLAASWSQTCGVDTAGKAWCWGSDADGKLGDGDDGQADEYSPVAVAGGHTFTTLAGGNTQTCGIDTAGTAWCWGRDDRGQVGDGDDGQGNEYAPVAVASGVKFTSVTAGNLHTCGLDTAGTAWCWGSDYGSLGDGDDGQADEYSPVTVAGGHTFTTLTAGQEHTCGIDTAGKAWCWGADGSGQVGDGDEGMPALAPVAVAGGHTFTTLTAGKEHTCGVDTNGMAWCWGADGSGTLGHRGDDRSGNTYRAPEPTPVTVAGGHTWNAVAAGYEHTCGVDTTGAAWCWGDDGFGQVGDGDEYVPAF
jgi:alpha-tubulin suppressor-like RCC1 family protein